MGTALKKRRPKSLDLLEPNLDTFILRFSAIMFAAREFVVDVARIAEKSGEDPYCTTAQVAEHIATHRPVAYIKSFGTDAPKGLKVWRITQLLRNASYLGAYEGLRIKVVHGKGMTVARPKGKRARLRVVK